MTYSEVIKYLNSFINYEKKTQYYYKQSFQLRRFQNFLKFINNPQSKLNIIHIAGSKGKGSVCAFIAYILKEAGFRVGLYTSPHLNDFRERIRILNQMSACPGNENKRQARDVRCQMPDIKEFEGMISKKEICNIVKKLKPKIDKFNKSSKYDALTHSTSLRVNPEPVEGLTFFEVYTALAFQYFKDQKVDTSTALSIPSTQLRMLRRMLSLSKHNPEPIRLCSGLSPERSRRTERTSTFKSRRVEGVDFVVLETGLGGRLDATNTCNSLLSVITPISLEHTYLLGNTLKKIAYEKAAIIKKENKKTDKGRILALTSNQDKSVMAAIEKVVQKNNALLFKQGRDFKFSKRTRTSFDYSGLNYKIKNLKINLLGSHQIANASLAVASIEALRYHRIDVGEKAIREGLKKCFWPARFEVVSKNPLIILDGAQNSASVRVLRKALKENFSGKKICLVFGISSDKELKDTCREIEKFGARIILTKSDNPRAAEPEDLLKYFGTNSLILTKNTKEALNVAKTKAKKQDLILVTGSLFVCGEIRQHIHMEDR